MRLTPRRTLLLAAPLLAAAVAWGWWLGAQRVSETRRELDELAARKEELEKECRRLTREVEALQHEKEARARAARESLDVVAPGEVMVVLPRPTPAVADSRPASEGRN